MSKRKAAKPKESKKDTKQTKTKGEKTTITLVHAGGAASFGFSSLGAANASRFRLLIHVQLAGKEGSSSAGGGVWRQRVDIQRRTELVRGDD